MCIDFEAKRVRPQLPGISTGGLRIFNGCMRMSSGATPWLMRDPKDCLAGYCLHHKSMTTSS
jgi:hypothetical protein